MAFPDGWGRKVALVIQNSQVAGSGSHTDFVVTIDKNCIPSEAIDAGGNSALNGGGDIRFSSDSAGTSRLPCEIVSFVTNATESSRQCEVYVKVPSVSTTADTTIYMWYQKSGESQPAVTDTYGRDAVWSDYALVCHGNGNTDSSGNQDLVPNSTDYSGDTGGLWGGQCFNFPKAAGQRHSASQSSLTAIPAMMQCWFYTNSDTGVGQGLVFADRSVTDRFCRLTNQDNIAGNPARMQSRDDTTWSISDTSTSTSVDTWEMVHGTVASDGATASYLNAGSKDTDATTVSVTDLDTFTIGEWSPSTTVPKAYIQPVDGLVDEVRIRKSVPSSQDDWITTEYNNQSSTSTFIVEGTPEDASGATYTLTASLSSVLQKTDITGTASLSSVLQKTQALLTTLSSALQKAGVTNTTELSAVLLKLMEVSSTLSAVLQKNVTVGATLNAYLSDGGDGPSTLTASLSSVLQKTDITGTASLSSVLQKLLDVNVTLSSVLQKGVTTGPTMSATLRGAQTLEASLSSVLSKGMTGGVSLISVLRKAVGLTLSVGATLHKAGESATASLSAYLSADGTFFTPDVMVYVSEPITSITVQ